MCGICGILQRDFSQPIDRALLERMNTVLRHRGPDDVGYHLQDGLGMAMRRLAIIDVAGGQQPITNEDSSIIVVFNGEIYNFLELRVELELHSHTFRTHSDTEVIVHAYEQWGDAALLRFNGMFAIALWDQPRRRLLLARDRMGKKPLYWHFSPHGLVWGSEAKALLQVPWIGREVNPVALHHYLTLQYVPDPLTIYQKMHRLPAAHKLTIEAGDEPKVERWWQLDFLPKLHISEPEAIEESLRLLRLAVKRRMISEVPLGAFLSGGIDSAVIVALMAEESRQPVKTFTIGFEEAQFSEAGYARQVAQRYGADHHEFIFRPADLQGLIESVVAAFDEPLADPAALPLYELARQACQHVTVALCGDGGDETLAGYTRYALDGLLQPYASLPTWITQKAVPALASIIPEPAWIPEDRNPFTGLRRLRQFAAVTPKASLVRWGSYFSHDDKLLLYQADRRIELENIDTANWLANAYNQAHADNHLDRTLYTDHITYLSGDLLPKTDRCTMAHSLEGRSPFLDAEWVEWTAKLPRKLKISKLHTKRLLKNTFVDLKNITSGQRIKHGFSIPVGLWFQRPPGIWAKNKIVENKALDNWFDREKISTIYHNHLNHAENKGKMLWALLIFSVWLELSGHA